MKKKTTIKELEKAYLIYKAIEKNEKFGISNPYEMLGYSSDFLCSIMKSISKIEISNIQNVYNRLRYYSEYKKSTIQIYYNQLLTQDFDSFLNSNFGSFLLMLFYEWNTIRIFKNNNLDDVHRAIFFIKTKQALMSKDSDILISKKELTQIKESKINIKKVLHFFLTRETYNLRGIFFNRVNYEPNAKRGIKIAAKKSPYCLVENRIYYLKENENSYTIKVSDVLQNKITEIDITEINFPLILDFKFIKDRLGKTIIKVQNTKHAKIIDFSTCLEEYKLFKASLELNPISTINKEKFKAINTFTLSLYTYLKKYYRNNKISENFLITLTGIINYDLGILKLDDTYPINEIISELDKKLEKKVSKVLVSKNVIRELDII